MGRIDGLLVGVIAQQMIDDLFDLAERLNAAHDARASIACGEAVLALEKLRESESGHGLRFFYRKDLQERDG